MSGYIGTQPVPQATETRYEETATASQTDFNVGGHQIGFIDVYLNGIKLSEDDFSDDGSTITLSTGAASGDLFAVVFHTIFEATNVQFSDILGKPTTLSGYGITDGLSNIVEDTTPQLGGTLDANGNDIDMGTNTITDTKVGQWDTAYGWGDHSLAGYATETYVNTQDNAKVSKSGSTMTGDLNFGDNVKSVYGAGSDLQIYHDGTHSYVEDTATGSLILKGADVIVKDSSNNDIAKFFNGGAAQLRYAGAVKLDTTNTGIDVTGAVTADGLTVDTATDVAINCSSAFDGIDITGSDVNGAGGRLRLLAPGASGTDRTLAILNDSRSSVDEIKFQANTDFAFSDSDTGDNRFRIADNGDISFYEDTGTTPKLFWDASEESLGVGLTNPANVGGGADLAVNKSGGARFVLNNNSRQWAIRGDSGSDDLRITARGSSDTVDVDTMTITTDGDVGIGTSSPTTGPTGTFSGLNITGDATNGELTALMVRNPDDTADTSGKVSIEMKASNSNRRGPKITAFKEGTYADATTADAGLSFHTVVNDAYVDALHIAQSGNVGIGTSSPLRTLHVSGAGDTGLMLQTTNAVDNNEIWEIQVAGNASNYADLIFRTRTNAGTGGSEAMRIDSSGNVGIGTSSPTADGLHIFNASQPDLFMGTTADPDGFAITYNDTDTSIGNSSNTPLRFRTNGSEAMRIDSSGNVGIGTDSPSSYYATELVVSADDQGGITIVGGTGDTGQYLMFADGTSGADRFRGYLQYNHTSNYMGLATNGSERMRLESDGDLHADGDVIAYSTTISDIRLKDNIAGINNALAKVGQLNGYTFEYKADGKVSAGVIAQEVEKVLPEAVSEKQLPLKTDDDQEYKVVNYDALHGLLIEAIKEQQAQIEELKSKVEALETK